MSVHLQPISQKIVETVVEMFASLAQLARARDL